MKTVLKKFCLVMGIALLSGCAGPSIKSYEGAKPELVLEDYFSGPIKAWGLVQDRKGEVIRRFDVDLVGRKDGNEIVLEEDFEYYDGKTERRVWRIRKMPDGSYEGRADDVASVAKGQSAGNALRLSYQMDVSVDGNTYRLNFDDWMFLMNDGVLINRSYLKKFGFTVAELTLVMQKQ